MRLFAHIFTLISISTIEVRGRLQGTRSGADQPHPLPNIKERRLGILFDDGYWNQGGESSYYGYDYSGVYDYSGYDYYGYDYSGYDYSGYGYSGDYYGYGTDGSGRLFDDAFWAGWFDDSISTIEVRGRLQGTRSGADQPHPLPNIKERGLGILFDDDDGYWNQGGESSYYGYDYSGVYDYSGYDYYGYDYSGYDYSGYGYSGDYYGYGTDGSGRLFDDAFWAGWFDDSSYDYGSQYYYYGYGDYGYGTDGSGRLFDDAFWAGWFDDSSYYYYGYYWYDDVADDASYYYYDNYGSQHYYSYYQDDLDDFTPKLDDSSIGALDNSPPDASDISAVQDDREEFAGNNDAAAAGRDGNNKSEYRSQGEDDEVSGTQIAAASISHENTDTEVRVVVGSIFGSLALLLALLGCGAFAARRLGKRSVGHMLDDMGLGVLKYETVYGMPLASSVVGGCDGETSPAGYTPPYIPFGTPTSVYPNDKSSASPAHPSALV
eukprot:CAMPEP_0172644964 /NCGR_PEP_ID=MMETSP1068-20121228/239484_1 /TAXON_ID=35684 /ORGANISM="Pseudopedinella elastica, Strain CCMP716" /LENGTH=489 /DNA_ID=CAMNT_0013459185 /DNA_START=285 /DNA_END=1754 /DNA_ORIENTATION=-